MQVSVTSLEVGSITSKYSGSSPADLHGMWYPPVRRTLLTLSKLYRCLELPIFTSLSQVGGLLDEQVSVELSFGFSFPS